jgi:general secretion pathway protein D
VVRDGEEASILVGSQVPYVTVDTRENAAGSIDRFEKVTIVDVGVSLTVRAHIHGDGRITMQVEPEVSTVSSFRNDIPVVETSNASSTVTITEGRTLLLGGLKRREIHKIRRGIPLLSAIPLIKYLFSSTDDEEIDTELVILLTPKLLSPDQDEFGDPSKEIRKLGELPEPPGGR